MSNIEQEEVLDKPKNTKKTALRLFKIVAEQKVRLIFILIAAFGYSIMTVTSPMIASDIIDSLLKMVNEQGQNGGLSTVLSYIGKPILLILMVYLSTSLFGFIQEFLVASVSERTTLSLKVKVSNKLNRTKLEFFDRNQTGETLSRMTNDMEKISEALQISTVQLITSIITVIGSIIMMTRMSWLLTVIALVAIIASIYITKLVAEKNLSFATKRQEKLGKLNSQVEEKYSGRVIIKAFNREQKSIEEIKEANNELYMANMRADFLMHAINPIIRLVNRIGYVLIALISGYLYINKAMTIGNIQAFIQYVNQLTEPLTQASFGVNSLQSALASAERIFEVLDASDEVLDKSTTHSSQQIKGNLKFEHVSFGYNETLLMKDINLEVKAGQMVAIVGPTGAGKTTLVNILMRFYEVNGGKILIDDVDITEYKRRELRKKFGMVLQDTWLFEGTIAENIAYGKPEASREEIVQTAKASRSDYFIRTLPNGYDSTLDNDVAVLSAGQKQLLTIARAMLTDPAILILDEATSSVDTRTEVAIQEAMNELMKGRTSLVIAHRLSTIRNADLILVMDHGTIIEQGTHHELLDQKGFYENLYNSQFVNGDFSG